MQYLNDNLGSGPNLHFIQLSTKVAILNTITSSNLNMAELKTSRRAFSSKEAIKCYWYNIIAVDIEPYIHWNGPQVQHAQSIVETALDRRFGGRTNWRFIAKENEFESFVMKRLKRGACQISAF